MNDFYFVLRDYAADFVTRDIGRLLREKLLAFEAPIQSELKVTIDASGVTIMTPSFVDEFFGRTAAELGLERFRQRFQVVGVDDDSKLLINNVVRNRLLLQRGDPETISLRERRLGGAAE